MHPIPLVKNTFPPRHQKNQEEKKQNKAKAHHSPPILSFPNPKFHAVQDQHNLKSCTEETLHYLYEYRKSTARTNP